MGSDSPQSLDAEAFLVSLQSIRKSGRVLYAFSQFYLPFYNLEIRALFEHYHIFACLSAAVYEIDESIEAGNSTDKAARELTRLREYFRTFVKCDAEICQLFDDALYYYACEQRILSGAQFSLAELTEVTAKRSFDFRLMHRSLIQLSGGRYDESVFSWFRAFEILMEIEDDLLSIEEDRARGTFNVFCLAEKIGPESAEQFVKEYRRSIEAELAERSYGFTELGRRRSAQILATYHEIVPRPEVPGSSETIL